MTPRPCQPAASLLALLTLLPAARAQTPRLPEFYLRPLAARPLGPANMSGRVTSPSRERNTRGRRKVRVTAGAVKVAISALSRHEPMKAAKPPRKSPNGTSPRTTLTTNTPGP